MGYDWGAGKSQRAVIAEDRGLMTATQLGKKLGVSAKSVRAVLYTDEWHHTSKMYNKTDYYDPEAVGDEDLAKMKALDAEARKAKKAQPVTKRCNVEYVEWTGTRKRPRKNEIVLTDVDVDFLPGSDFVVIHAPSGPMRKSSSSRWIKITALD
jgi:hypothetical protein